jgi:small subunit ribosomal protein S16
MLIIRLSRYGRKNDPSFRVVLKEKQRAPSGKAIEFLGFYNARLKQKNLKTDRIKHWISQGAQVSDTVHNLLVSDKTVEGPKKKVTFVRKKETEKVKEKELKVKADAEKSVIKEAVIETTEIKPEVAIAPETAIVQPEMAKAEPEVKEETPKEADPRPDSLGMEKKEEVKEENKNEEKPASEEKQEK